MNKITLITLAGIGLCGGCATIVNDPMTPIAFSFSDGSEGHCELQNKRGSWPSDIPSTVSVRRSDDGLRYDCKTEDGKTSTGVIPSEIGGEIVASAVFIDFGITDAITDKHRRYPASFVIPVTKSSISTSTAEKASSEGEVDPFDMSVGGEDEVEQSTSQADSVDPLDVKH